VGRRPLLLDLDTGEGAAGMPGTLTALSVDKPRDVETGYARYGARFWQEFTLDDAIGSHAFDQ
jgi:hypothetical protein